MKSFELWWNTSVEKKRSRLRRGHEQDDPTRFANEIIKDTGTHTTPRSSFCLDCQIIQDQFEWSSNLRLEMRSVSFMERSLNEKDQQERERLLLASEMTSRNAWNLFWISISLFCSLKKISWWCGRWFRNWSKYSISRWVQTTATPEHRLLGSSFWRRTLTNKWFQRTISKVGKCR